MLHRIYVRCGCEQSRVAERSEADDRVQSALDAQFQNSSREYAKKTLLPKKSHDDTLYTNMRVA